MLYSVNLIISTWKVPLQVSVCWNRIETEVYGRIRYGYKAETPFTIAKLV